MKSSTTVHGIPSSTVRVTFVFGRQLTSQVTYSFLYSRKRLIFYKLFTLFSRIVIFLDHIVTFLSKRPKCELTLPSNHEIVIRSRYVFV